MRTVKINTVSLMKFILIIIFLFNSFLAFTQTNGQRCVEGFPQKRGNVNGEWDSKDSLESQIGYSFKNPELKRIALKQRSVKSYYRHNTLEFLGDAVFGLFMAEILVKRYDWVYTRVLHSAWEALVSNRVFAQWASILQLDQYAYRKGRYLGEQVTLKLADFLEALMGAIYLDGGHESAQNLSRKFFEISVDYMSNRYMLHEIVQNRFNKFMSYEVKIITSTPYSANHPLFIADVKVGDQVLGSGKGTNKSIAKEQAALSALNKLEADTPLIINRGQVIKILGLQKPRSLEPDLDNYSDHLAFLGKRVFDLYVTVFLLDRHIYSPRTLSSRRHFFHKLNMGQWPEELKMAIVKVLDKRGISLKLPAFHTSILKVSNDGKLMKERGQYYSAFYFLLGEMYLKQGPKKAEALVRQVAQDVAPQEFSRNRGANNFQENRKKQQDERVPLPF